MNPFIILCVLLPIELVAMTAAGIWLGGMSLPVALLLSSIACAVPLLAIAW